MEVASIQPVVNAGFPGRQGAMSIARQQMLIALTSAQVPSDRRHLLMETLLVWGTIAGRVIEKQANGNHILEIAGTKISLRLPEARPVGETVLLTLTDPGQDMRALAQGAGHLSNASRLLASIASGTGESGAVPDTEPLAATGKSAQLLTQALSRAIAASGLFYESHLALWSEERYPMAELQREPQFRARLDGAADLGPTGTAGEQPAVVAESVLPLLRQQLRCIETQTIHWAGWIWPGQTVRLEIHPDQPSPATAPDPDSVWITRVNLDLPRLGMVEALVALRADRVAVSVSSASSQASGELLAVRSELEQALLARGLRTEALVVKTAEARQ
jgi:hypothetical protein